MYLMVHSGRLKHPALHLQYHLPGQLNMAPCGRHISRCRQPCIQADLYSGAWVRLGWSLLPADFILLTRSIDYLTF
jgi:hypothetical protein